MNDSQRSLFLSLLLQDEKKWRQLLDKIVLKSRFQTGTQIHLANNAFQERLNKTTRALKRLRDGGFGRCIDCEQMIAIERLRKIPNTDRCFTCQRQHEKQQRVDLDG